MKQFTSKEELSISLKELGFSKNSIAEILPCLLPIGFTMPEHAQKWNGKTVQAWEVNVERKSVSIVFTDGEKTSGWRRPFDFSGLK